MSINNFIKTGGTHVRNTGLEQAHADAWNTLDELTKTVTGAFERTPISCVAMCCWSTGTGDLGALFDELEELDQDNEAALTTITAS